jgi:hypothetical protein
VVVVPQDVTETGQLARQDRDLTEEQLVARGMRVVAVELEVLAQMELVLVLQAVRV